MDMQTRVLPLQPDRSSGIGLVAEVPGGGGAPQVATVPTPVTGRDPEGTLNPKGLVNQLAPPQ